MTPSSAPPGSRPPRRRALSILGGVPLALAGVGCTAIGPRTITETRTDYNLAIQQTNDQELLLNLVRIRYRDSIYFTQVERVAATVELNRTLGSAATAGWTDNTFTQASNLAKEVSTRALTLGPGSISLNERPTIFYAPLDGDRFVRQMMLPMPPAVLLLLVQSGWQLDTVFALGVADLAGQLNDPGLLADGRPVRTEHGFSEAIRLMARMYRSERLSFARTRDGSVEHTEVRFLRGSGQEPDGLRLKRLLTLAPEKETFRLVPNGEPEDLDTVSMRSRPLLASMNHLSYGVEVPEAHVLTGRVQQIPRGLHSLALPGAEGRELFRIKASTEQPAQASVAIRYREHWFWIDDTDHDSKRVFLLLTQLLHLLAVPTTAGPAMSFSFGR